ncbi:MAG: L,D-transpeptidase family protein [Clostridia bacterium]|nr:L,D-transpeptidase family protein [Clostridia bacterium]
MFRKILCLLLCLLMLPCIAGAEEQELLYTIDVDITNQYVTVYSAADGGIVRQMICSTGYGATTPTGTFYMEQPRNEVERTEWYWFGEYEVFAKYASRITGSILFHSILYNDTASQPTWNSLHGLGEKASHGCVRLYPEDAQWIAENCPPGTQVNIFESGGERNEELRELLKYASFSIDESDYETFLRGLVTLERGSSFASKVKELQEALNALGYSCGAADGYFGAQTEEAVKAWQADNGQGETGIVTPQQLDALLSGRKPDPTPVPTATPVPTPEPTPIPTPGIDHIEGTAARAKVDSYLKLRAEPNGKADVLAMLENAAPMQVLEEGAAWTKVVYEGITGYVSSDYIEIIYREEAAAAPTPEPTATPEPTPKINLEDGWVKVSSAG